MTDPQHPPGSAPDAAPPPGLPRRGRPPLGPLVLIGLGALLVLHQFGFAFNERWWTAFILIPAGAALVAATRFYRAGEGWSARAIGALVGGVLLMALWAKLFFGGLWHDAAGHLAAWHDAGWHAMPFHGHGFVFPLVLLVVGLVLLMRRRRWQR